MDIQIFIRSSKRVVSISQPGKAVLEISRRILRDVQNIENIGSEFTNHDNGSLTIATTHIQARYALPKTVAELVKNYPKVSLTIKQGSSSTITQMVSSGEADLVIIIERIDNHPELDRLPCYEWNHIATAPYDHPLLDYHNPLNPEDLASFLLVAYELVFNSGSSIARTLNKVYIKQLDVALSTTDTDVLKTYVCLGLGVGLMVEMAYDSVVDQDLQLIDATYLLESSSTWVALRIDTYLCSYAYGFMQTFAPKLTREVVDCILRMPVVEDLLI